MLHFFLSKGSQKATEEDCGTCELSRRRSGHEAPDVLDAGTVGTRSTPLGTTYVHMLRRYERLKLLDVHSHSRVGKSYYIC